ncbi:AI-2E family transporter [soil metagenome]
MRDVENKSFVLLVILASLGLLWVVLPFFGAILWAVVATVLFTPLHTRFRAAMPHRRNSAALLTLLVIIAVVIIPALLIGALLLQEINDIYLKVQTGELNVAHSFTQFQAILPTWAGRLLERFGLTDFEAVQARIGAGIASSFQTLAGRALSIGQSAFGLIVALGVMLYLTFFLLRDGKALAARIDAAIPLDPVQWRSLTARFITVIRATIKGSLVVAVAQGLIGGVVFWGLGIQGAILWGVSMAFFSLLPAIGTGLIWVPVAIYLLVSGAIWQGVVLVLCGLFVIGMVDNVLRPILVGRDTRMPDYVVLISTLGGLEVFGFNGFVIGPVIAALFMAVWEIFTMSRRNSQDAAAL